MNWRINFKEDKIQYTSSYMEYLFNQFKKKNPNYDYIITPVKPRQKRTLNQNSAIHLWFGWVAEALNDAGYNVQIVLKQKMDIDWTPELVKEILWKTAQNYILKKQSTTELNKHEEIDLVYDHLNRHLGEKFGIHIPFPNGREYEKINDRFVSNH